MEVNLQRAAEGAPRLSACLGSRRGCSISERSNFRREGHSRKVGISLAPIPGPVALLPPFTEYRVFGDYLLCCRNSANTRYGSSTITTFFGTGPGFVGNFGFVASGAFQYGLIPKMARRMMVVTR